MVAIIGKFIVLAAFLAFSLSALSHLFVPTVMWPEQMAERFGKGAVSRKFIEVMTYAVTLFAMLLLLGVVVYIELKLLFWVFS